MLVTPPTPFPARVEVFRGGVTAFDTNAFVASCLKSHIQPATDVEFYLTEATDAFAFCCHDCLSRYVATDEKLFNG